MGDDGMRGLFFDVGALHTGLAGQRKELPPVVSLDPLERCDVALMAEGALARTSSKPVLPIDAS